MLRRKLELHELTRRDVLRLGMGVGMLACGPSRALFAASGPVSPLSDLGPKAVGKLRPRASKEIAASPLSVGFETLDRRLFDPEKTYAPVGQLGVKWARCQTGWARTERTKGVYDFAWLDGVVDSLRGVGVQPWFNLGYGNPLYTPEADAAAVGWAPVFSEPGLTAWLAYVAALAAHFADRVKHWEVWNEPNISGFWKPRKPDPADYCDLVKRTVPAIRQHVPGAVIVGGAFAGAPVDYLRKCLEQGLGDAVDRMSYHPYRAVPESNYERDVAAMRELLQRYTAGRVKLWQGENGCPSEKGGSGALSQYDWTETRQAKWLLRRIVGDLHLDIELTSYFLIVDLVGYRGNTNPKGLLRGRTYEPKPAYYAYQRLCALFDAETRRSEGSVRFEVKANVPIQVATFQRRGVPLCAYWTPADLMKDFAVTRVEAALSPGPGTRWAEPVLIDPLTGWAYRLDAAADGRATLPLTDYPLVITEQSVVALSADDEQGVSPARRGAEHDG